jgi:hypothetical protein
MIFWRLFIITEPWNKMISSSGQVQPFLSYSELHFQTQYYTQRQAHIQRKRQGERNIHNCFSFSKTVAFILTFLYMCTKIIFNPHLPFLSPSPPTGPFSLVPRVYSCLFAYLFVFRSKFSIWKPISDIWFSESGLFDLIW